MSKNLKYCQSFAFIQLVISVLNNINIIIKQILNFVNYLGFLPSILEVFLFRNN